MTRQTRPILLIVSLGVTLLTTVFDGVSEARSIPTIRQRSRPTPAVSRASPRPVQPPVSRKVPTPSTNPPADIANQPVQRKSTVPSPKAIGAQKTAVILVNFQDNPAQPLTPGQIQDLVFNPTTGVSSLLYENSYRQTWLEGTVVGWYTLPMVAPGCSHDAIDATFDQAVRTADPDLNYRDYSHVIVMFPVIPACNWGSYGVPSRQLDTLDGRTTASRGLVQLGPWDSTVLSKTIFRVLGMSLGLDPANRLDCFPDVMPTTVLENSCKEQWWGDVTSGMTNSISGWKAHFTSIEKERLGWLTSEQIQTLDTPGTSTHLIAPLETFDRGLKALRILKEVTYRPYPPLNAEKIWYYLEYRRPIGLERSLFDPLSNLLKGGLFHFTFSKLYQGPSVLLDMTPTDLRSQQGVDVDVTLRPGRTFTDPSGTIVKVLGATEAGLEVQVTIPRDTMPPQIRWYNSELKFVGGTGLAVLKLPLVIEAWDNFGGIQQFSFYDNGTLLGHAIPPEFSFLWDPFPLPEGSVHTLQVRAKDAAGNEGKSREVTVTVDHTPPTVRLRSPSPGAILSGVAELVIEADDANGVKVVDWVARKEGEPAIWSADGATSTGHDGPSPFFHALWDTTKQPDGRYQVTAFASDQAGNSAEAMPVLVTVRNLSLPTDRTPPNVRIVAPTTEAVVSGVIPIVVEAEDPSGIKGVWWYRGPKIGGFVSSSAKLTQAPYRFRWDTTELLEDRTYSVYAEAMDSAGNIGESEWINVTVRNRPGDQPKPEGDRTKPTVTLLRPTQGDVVGIVTSVEFRASDDQVITEVNLYRDGVLVETSVSPFRTPEYVGNIIHTINPAVDGARHTFQLRAKDAAGNEGVSAEVTVTLDSAPPTVKITSPQAEAILSGQVNVVTDVQDKSPISWVIWKVLSEKSGKILLIREAKEPPYQFVLDTKEIPDGRYRLLASAMDAVFNEGSHGIYVTVNNQPRPPPQPTLLQTVLPNRMLQLSWSGGGILQSASAVTGPWEDMPSAQSPFLVPMTGQAQFFRLKPVASDAAKPLSQRPSGLPRIGLSTTRSIPSRRGDHSSLH